MGSMANYEENVARSIDALKNLEQVLGKGLTIPMNYVNSGQRKVLANIQQSHRLVLDKPDIAYVSTGYEKKFGEKSSALLFAEDNLEVIGKVSKFSDNPNHFYYLFVVNHKTGEMNVFERSPYKHSTEIYGYLKDNTYLDNCRVGTIINKGDVIRKSIGYDDYENHMKGRNLNVAYMNTDHNMEDSFIMSESCSEKMSTTFLKKVTRIINENDICLNIYGNNEMYKTFPNIGEKVKNGILMAFRTEDKENAIYSQSVNRLQEIEMSDKKVTLHGRVVDINIYSNKDESFDTIYNSQFAKYHADIIKMYHDIVALISPLQNRYTMSYELDKLFTKILAKLNGQEYINKKKYSNMYVEFIVADSLPLMPGDKIADRYGGKGVGAKYIIPDHLMPRLKDGTVADMIKNAGTSINRENIAQNMEITINYISSNIIKKLRIRLQSEIETNGYLPEEVVINSLVEIGNFMGKLSTKEYNKFMQFISVRNAEDKREFLYSILEKDCIHIVMDPMSDLVTIDTLRELYDTYTDIEPERILVPQEDSKGNIRYIETRIPVMLANQYIYRLKQVAEEKQSATSLSSTNIKNENSKSKSSKEFESPILNTPVRMGGMESGQMSHIGTDIVVMNMMLHSVSPSARMQVEQIATEDPYNIDVKVNSSAVNRSVEQTYAKLKTIGLKIVFEKRRKKRKRMVSYKMIEYIKPMVEHGYEKPKMFNTPMVEYIDQEDTEYEIYDIDIQ